MPSSMVEEKNVLPNLAGEVGDPPASALSSHIVSHEVAHNAFNQVCECFERARLLHPQEYVEAYYTLAGKVVAVRIVGRALAAFYQRAFAPRATPSAGATASTPALTIDLWDESVTAQPYPLPVIDGEQYQRSMGDHLVPFGDESGRWIWGEKAGNVTWLDRKANRAIGWRAQGALLPTHERSKPLSALLPIWLNDHNIHILHAGMVAANGNGILITGGSGIGKTTTTLCCLLGGLDYLSDDQVAVAQSEEGEGSFIAHSIFQSARLLPDHLQRFPALQPHAILSKDPRDPKTLLFLAELFPERVVAQAPIRAIALPRLSGQAETTFQRAKRAEALNYMARTSLLTPFGIGRARSTQLVQLLAGAPCYWLELGHDLTLIPPTIEQLLREAR